MADTETHFHNTDTATRSAIDLQVHHISGLAFAARILVEDMIERASGQEARSLEALYTLSQMTDTQLVLLRRVLDRGQGSGSHDG